MATVFDNPMTAHAWAQFTQPDGRSHNGNLFFHGRALYSYGPHYVAGYILPAAGNPDGRGAALINADSYSVSTGRHVGYARSAAIGRAITVPNLTDLARLFERGIARASGVDGRRIKAGELARFMGPNLKAHFSDPDNAGGLHESDVAAVFRAAQCDNPERRAAAALAAAGRTQRKAAERAAKRKTRETLDMLARIARINPADVPAEMESAARRAAPYGRGSTEQARGQYEERGKAALRAMKAGKAAGRSAQVRKASEVRKAIRANLWRFGAALERAERAKTWRHYVGHVRNGIAAVRGEPIRVMGRGSLQHGPAGRANVAKDGAAAARNLAGALTGPRAWAAAPARVTGQNPEELARRLSDLAGELDSAVARLERAERMGRERGELAALKLARDLPADAPAADAAAVLKGALQVAEKYAARAADDMSARIWPESVFTGPDGRRYRNAHGAKIPGAFRLSGWTPFRFRKAADMLKARETAAREELARIAREEREEAERAALAAWRAGEEIPRELRRFTPRARPDGSVYIRARGVERDAAGNVTAGELVTSQGAAVPLVHAVRVFRFLKACRAAGRGWQANGRTLRVGLFRVDSVAPDGSFRAGCHAFAWEEVARLAEELGIADVAPADVTEERAPA